MGDAINAQRNTSAVSSADNIQSLVYGISHDMGAPLRGIVQFTQLLEKRLADRLDDKERYWMQLVLDGGHKAQAMLDGLLCYSKLSSSSNHYSQFNLNDIVQAVINELADAEKKCCTIASPLPQLYGFTDHWILFFSCIIDNALKYQPKYDECHNPCVEVHSQCTNGVIQVCIDDNGIGVSESYIATLSRPFMRAQSEADYPGLGMGLSYCERIAQLHGGQLQFAVSPLNGLRVIYSYQEKNQYPSPCTEANG